MKRALASFLLSLLVTGLLLSCDFNIGGGPEPYIPQTEILGFRFGPNDTVQVGDTLRITCVIEDSTNSSFEFIWVIKDVFAGVTNESTLSVIIPDVSIGEKTGSVNVSSPTPPEGTTSPVEAEFEFYVENSSENK